MERWSHESGKLTGPALGDLLGADLTYPEVGRTRGDMPLGYQHLSRSLVVGVGVDCFREASTTLLQWDVHRRAGMSVRASSESVMEGAVAVLRLGWGLLGVNAPVRVVYVIEEAHRRGFAYGTLPGHPERGEEAFVVELRDGGEVSFAIRAFSRPESLLARAGGPVARAVQRWATHGYLHALDGSDQRP
jgi:uncharacterized protein (UPF0548 family)